MESTDLFGRYRQILGGYTKGLLTDPVGFAPKLNVLQLVGQYKKDDVRVPNLREAIALWSLFYEESAFYREIKNRLYAKQRGPSSMFVERIFNEAKKSHIDSLSEKLQPLAETAENPYVRIFAMYMLLPSEVARRWLWKENIDFQTPESFLRRLTSTQYESLAACYWLSKEKPKLEDYPCFKEGEVNTIWNMFGLKADNEPRMTPKSAIAYDFLGMNIGFQKYPKLEEDGLANHELASQFLSSENRGRFEVNKEVGGIYWYLYRTLRSNSLYRKDKEVKLGAWICPGFWFTMMAWFFLLVISPVCLFATVAIYFMTHEVVSSLGIVGLATPLLFGGGWVRENLGKGDFDGDYWPYLGATCILLVFGFGFAFLFGLLREYHGFWALLVCVIFLLPYCVSNDTGKFWKLDYLGKPLTGALILAVSYDLWLHTEFWQSLVSLLHAWALALIQMIVENWKIILIAISIIAGYVALLVGTISLFSRNSAKMEKEAQEKKSLNEDNYYAMNALFYVMLAFSFAFIAYFTIHFLEYLIPSMILILLLSVPFVWPVVSKGFERLNPKHILLQKDIEKYLFSASLNYLFVREVAGNNFWFETKPLRVKSEMLITLYRTVPDESQWRTFAVAISSDTEFERVVAFYEAEVFADISRPYRQGRVPSDELVRLILSGSSPTELREWINQEEVRLRAAQTLSAERRNVAMKAVGGVATAFEWLCNVLWTPFRLVGRLAADVYHMWKLLNSSCPAAPPSEKGSFV